jgi:hypothetical protein
MCDLIFPKDLSEIFLTLRVIGVDIITNVRMFPRKVPVIIIIFAQNIFSLDRL